MPIDTVPVESLHARLKFRQPIDYPADSRRKAPVNWQMEVDDAPIFRYLYRNFAPRRHLEFGTWQGFGTLCCLQETNATVWTINLPFGVYDKPDGLPAYSNAPQDAEAVQAWAYKIGLPPSNDYYWTDKIGFIGRMYLERSLGNRVCQIYCDSQNWDVANYPSNFFDSVLIDGGHEPEIVLSDTQKALRVLRPGGLILWHDFSLQPEVRAQFPWVDQLVTAMGDNLPLLESQLKDLFWIEPSWILAGVRASGSGRVSGYLRRLCSSLLARPIEAGG